MGASWIYVRDGDARFFSSDLTGEGSAGDVFAQHRPGLRRDSQSRSAGSDHSIGPRSVRSR
jgi:hypothetical protein